MASRQTYSYASLTPAQRKQAQTALQAGLSTATYRRVKAARGWTNFRFTVSAQGEVTNFVPVVRASISFLSPTARTASTRHTVVVEGASVAELRRAVATATKNLDNGHFSEIAQS